MRISWHVRKRKQEKKTTGVRDVRFFTKDWALVAHKNLESHGHMVEFMLVKYCTQKNREKDETVMNRWNGLDLDPVVIWMRIIRRLVKNRVPTTYINTVYVRGTDKSFRVTSTMVINMSRNTVTIMGSARLGIPIKSIGTHSIRTSFAMMLNLNKKPDSLIMKQGCWKSASFLKYIRNLQDSTTSLYHFFTCKKHPKLTQDKYRQNQNHFIHLPQYGNSINIKSIITHDSYFSTWWFFLRYCTCSSTLFGFLDGTSWTERIRLKTKSFRDYPKCQSRILYSRQPQ